MFFRYYLGVLCVFLALVLHDSSKQAALLFACGWAPLRLPSSSLSSPRSGNFLGIFTPHPRGKCLSTDWWGWDINNATSSPLVRTLLQGDFDQCTPSSQSANFLPSRTRWVCGRTETYTWLPSQGNSSVKGMSAEINSGLHDLAASILPHHGPGTLGSQTAELYRPALNSTDFCCLQSDLHERASVTFVDMALSCSLAWPPSFLFSFCFLETLISDLSMTLSVSICF